MNEKAPGGDVLDRLQQLIHQRITDGGAESYVAQLVRNGDQPVLKKLGEEAIELILAANSGDKRSICHESADLVFHMMVLLARHDIRLEQVLEQLQKRMGTTGLQEKALRSTLKSS